MNFVEKIAGFNLITIIITLKHPIERIGSLKVGFRFLHVFG